MKKVTRIVICLALILILAPISGLSRVEAQTGISGHITRDTTWSGTVIVTGDVIVDKGVTLTIEPGTIIKFERISADLIVNGALKARGTPSAKIQFTSSAAKPDTWGGIVFNDSSDDAQCILEHCIIRYGGRPSGWGSAANNTNIRLNAASPTIRYCVISNADGHGILTTGGSNPIINYNNIYDNADYGIRNANTSVSINAVNNWWGTAIESEIEKMIYDQFDQSSLSIVDYRPFLSAPHPLDTGMPDVPVTGVTLAPATLNLAVGDTPLVLTVGVLPQNATNKAVTWSSDKPAVVTVDANGRVTAIAAGTATITVTTADGGHTATCAVTSAALSPGIVVNIGIQPPTRDVVIGETFTLDIQVDAGDQPVAGVSAFLDFDPAYLEVVSITRGGTLNVVMAETFDNDAGTIDYSASRVTEPFPSGTFTLATIEFRPIQSTPATAIDFGILDPRKTMAAYEGRDVTGIIAGRTVEVIPDAPVALSIALQGGTRPPEGWELPVTIKFFEPGADVLTDTPVKSLTVTTAKIGDMAVAQASILPGTYDITVAGDTTLISVRRNVDVGPAVDMGTLLEGNANGDHIINMIDFSILAGSFMKTQGDQTFDKRADFDRNGIVNMIDVSLLAANFMKKSPR